MAGPVTDPRAHALRDKFHAAHAAPNLPVPVEAIAEDLDCSGLLVPVERRVVLGADEPQSRRRFTLTHEMSHWVCQVKEGDEVPMYCRPPTWGRVRIVHWSEKPMSSPRSC